MTTIVESGRVTPAPATSAPRRLDRNPYRWIARRVGPSAVVVLTAAVSLGPVYFVVTRALGDRAAAVSRMLDSSRFTAVLRTTLLLAIGSVVIATVLGTLLAWAAHCLPHRRRWLGVIPMLPLAMPALAVICGYAFVFSPTAGFGNTAIQRLPFIDMRRGPFDVYSLPFIVGLTGLILSAYVYLFVRSALSALHQDLIDAAAISGASGPRRFMRVVLPLLKPALLYGSLTSLMLALGQFTVPLLLGRSQGVDVLTTEMYRAVNQSPPDPRLASAYGLPILVAGLMLLVFQRRLVGEQDRYVTSGGKGNRPIVSNGVGAQLSLVLYGVVSVGLPFAALVVVSLQPYWNREIIVRDLGLKNWRAVYSDDALRDAILNTLRFSAMACLVALALGYACARVIYQRREHRILAWTQDAVASAPLGIPAVIFGAGFLMVYTVTPLSLHGKSAGMVLLYVVLTLPFVTRMLLGAMYNLGTDLSEAAGVHGAGFFRRLFKVDVPMLRGPMCGAAALAFVITSHEFSASILVRATDTQVMGTVLYDLWMYASYPKVAVMAMTMCAITTGGVLVALLLNRKP